MQFIENRLKDNLKAELKKRKLSLAALAQGSRTPKSTLHSWTIGQAAVNLTQLRAVCDFLQIPVDQLVWGNPTVSATNDAQITTS